MDKKCLLPLMFALLACFGFYKKQPTHTDKANAFIKSLNDSQRQQLLLPFYGMDGRKWAFVPNASSHPPGVAIKDMDSLQKQKAFDLLHAYLSEKGYQKARKIMDLEYLLRVTEKNNPIRIPEDYVMIIYGTPHPDSLWAWAFQGHHVIFNFTVVKDKVAFAPFFLGSNPGEVREGPNKGQRILNAEEDIAYGLMNDLTDAQRAKATIMNKSPVEIITGAATTVTPLPVQGTPMKEMTQKQKGLMNSLLLEYLSAMPPMLANMRYRNIQNDDMDDIYFAWAGSLNRQDGHYYRVQGKSFLIEFDNTQNNANHIHTVWRDFNGDFGRDLLLEHYKTQHQ